jgi:hypothetical protein
MRSKLLMLSAFAAITHFYSCKSAGNENITSNYLSDNKILQKEDGTISLELQEAACYSDMEDPSGNTAEWDVVISKTGRYDVWLSSFTKDSTNLNYKNSVKVSVDDTRIEAHPEVDKIVDNSSDGDLRYYTAGSFMGSMFIQDTGLLSFQVISEKILPKDYNWNNGNANKDDSKLISIHLTPEKSR